LKKLATDVGFLRVFHGLFLLLLMVSVPFAGGESARHGFAMWPTLIAPALVPIFFFVLPLDMFMAAVSRGGATDSEVNRLNRVLKYDIVLLILLLLTWVPFFAQIITER
jgi:hypothetical protein